MTCKFTNVSLDNLPDTYKAISYCWGDASSTDKVWAGENRYLELNSSAASILKAIAAQKSDRYFWIDAICIDQKDQNDKNNQVPLMGDIYSSAVQVIAWLGSPSKDSDQAIDFIDHLFKSITDLFRRNVPVTMDSLSQSADCQFPSPGWTALARFLQRPWFQRTWIIQEVVLATDVLIICGGNALKWKGLADVVSIISGNGFGQLLTVQSEGEERFQGDGVTNIQIVYSMKVLRDNHGPLELHYNLLNCYNFEATDPRDKVWALLGMTTNAKWFREHVDYNMRTQDVFTVTTGRQLADESSLDILHAAGIGNPRTLSDLPSWVPDWGSIPRRTILGGIAKNMQYTASGATKPWVRVDQEAKTVMLTGVIVDTIKSILPPRPLDPVHKSLERQKETKQMVQAWLVDSLNFARSSKQYASDTGRDRALWATLTANISYINGPGTPAAAEDFENFLAWRGMVSELAFSEDWDQVAFPAEYVRKAQACIRALADVGKRRVYMTERGYLGLGPEGLEDRDRITAFHGAATPFIIRKGESTNAGVEIYALVGECYTHGLMDGECLSMGEEQHIVLV